jgi:cell division protein FtsI/penicillin-binding protein 2
LQALGEFGLRITPAELAMAYRRLAVNVAEMEAIRRGLEGAVEYGTAQRAAVVGVTVAGKTGSTRTADGKPVAWFAGFAPSRAPKIVVTVMLQGNSGGADAAPLGGRILQAFLS